MPAFPLIDKAWRLAVHGAAFLLFGAGSLVLVFIVFPLIRFSAPGHDAATLRTQKAIQSVFRLFVRFLVIFGAMENVRMSGGERLTEKPGRLIVANHPTLIDVVVLGARLPQVDCVAKGALWENPFLRGVMRAAGYIPNDDGPALVERTAERLRAGRNVLLFPEGTRSPEGGLGPFSKGFARVALSAGCEVLPVVIRCDPPALSKGRPFHRIPSRKVQMDLSVLPPLRASDLVDPAMPAPLAAKALTSAVRGLMEERLNS